MVDAVWSESTPQPSLHLTPQPQTTITPQYLQISYGNAGNAGGSRRESLLSPSPNRRTKVQRGIAGECLQNIFCYSISVFFFFGTARKRTGVCTATVRSLTHTQTFSSTTDLKSMLHTHTHPLSFSTLFLWCILSVLPVQTSALPRHRQQ